MKYERILALVASTTWAMDPEKLSAMVSVLRRATFAGKLPKQSIKRALEASRKTAEATLRASMSVEAARMHPNTDRSVAGRKGGVALIPVRGMIAHRASMVDDVSPGTGTSCEALTQQIRAARASDAIKAIVLDVDSPGGSTDGITELASEIYSGRGGKPMIAQINATAASAAYWIASAADEIVITPSGQAGSIGVYGVHEDISKMLQAAGINPTIISAGKYKVEGNEFEPLSDEARAAIQERVNAHYATFTGDVAKFRGVNSSDVRDGYGQGRSLGAAAALAAGLVDRIGTMSETLQRWGIAPPTSNMPRADGSITKLSVLQRRLKLMS